MRKTDFNGEKGITLIALVITIIVLLILAGVAISMLSGENGILVNAVEARKQMEREEKLENVKLAVIASMLNDEHIVKKDLLEQELRKIYNDSNIKITELGDEFVIEIGENVYRTNSNGELDNNIYISETKETKETTEEIKIENNINNKLTNYKLYGNSEQVGTPTHDTPVEIESVGDYDETTEKYKIPIKVSGKNILDVQNMPVHHCNAYVPGYKWWRTETGFKVELLNDYDNKIWFTHGFNIGTSEELKGKTITVSVGEYIGKGLSSAIVVSHTDVEGDNVEDYDDMTSYKPGYVGTTGSTTLIKVEVGNNITCTIPEDVTGEYISVRFYLFHDYVGPIAGDVAEYKNLQIEINDTATPYEPFIEPVTTNIYLDEPLRKIGAYEDYIDFENKILVRNIESIELQIADMDNSEDYPGWKNQTTLKEDFPDANIKLNQISNGVLNNICSNQNLIGINNKTTGSLWFDKSVINLSQTEWITNYPSLVLNVQYVKPLPQNTPINLPAIPMHKGTNIITIDTKIKPSNFVYKYISQ